MENEDSFMLGVINPEELYSLAAFKRRLGITSATLRTARRAGLRVFYVHKQGFIRGRDWIEYVTTVAPDRMCVGSHPVISDSPNSLPKG